MNESRDEVQQAITSRSTIGRDPGLLFGLAESFERLSAISVLAITTALIALIGALDYATGPKLDMMVLYILPVFFAAWVLGRNVGAAGALACALTAWPQYLRDGSADAAFNTVGRAVVLSLVAGVVAGLRQGLVRERQRSNTDPLTGAMNRRALLDRLEMDSARSLRTHEPLSLMFIDLDEFKALNDRHGHALGDTVLRSVAHALQAAVRSTDSVARIGGDEFAILLPASIHADAVRVAHRIEASLAVIEGGSGHISASIGVATFVTPLNDEAAMLARSDRLMYEAKHTSRGKIAAEVILDATRQESGAVASR